MSNLGTCMACDRRGACPANCVCLDGVPIRAHADAGYCPHPDGPRFGSGIKPDGWQDDPAAYIKPRPAPVPAAPGPGDAMKSILERMGFRSTVNGVECPNGKTLSACGCAAMQRRMNQMGWLGCLLHAGELAKWFTEKAAQCGVTITIGTVTEFILTALKQSRLSK